MKLSEQMKLMNYHGAPVGPNTINNWILEAERMEKEIRKKTPNPLDDQNIFATYLNLVYKNGANIHAHPDAVNAQVKALIELREMIRSEDKD